MQWEGQVYNAKDGQTLQLDDQACRHRPAGDSGLRARLPVRRRDLDARRPADPIEPRQQHGQGCAEGSTGAASRTRAGTAAPAAQRLHRLAGRLMPRPAKQRARKRARRADPRSAISAYSPTSRGLPISAGWNSSTAASVDHEATAPAVYPCCAVPGWLDSHRLPNAVAVVSALKKIARVRLDCSRFVLPARHAVT